MRKRLWYPKEQQDNSLLIELNSHASEAGDVIFIIENMELCAYKLILSPSEICANNKDSEDEEVFFKEKRLIN